MNQVELKKFEFDYRGMSRLTPFSGTYGPTRIQCMDENHASYSNIPAKVKKASHRELEKKPRSVILKRNEVENRDESKSWELLELLDDPDSNAWTEVKDFKQYFSESREFSNSTLVWEIKRVDMESNEFEYEDISKSPICWHSWTNWIPTE